MFLSDLLTPPSEKMFRLDSVTFTLIAMETSNLLASVLISTYVHIIIPTSLQLQLFVQNAITPDGISPGCHIERMRFVFHATDRILLGIVTSSLNAKLYYQFPDCQQPAQLLARILAQYFLYATDDLHLLQHAHLTNIVHDFRAKFTNKMSISCFQS